MARVFKQLVFAVFVLLVLHFFKTKRHPLGILIKNDPVQAMVPNVKAVCGNPDGFTKDGYTFKPLATFRLSARVLGLKRYYRGPSAKVAPFDMAVGWGPMSDQAVLDQLKLSQGNRFYFYEWQNQPPLPKEVITSHSTNIHLIASSEATERAIKRTDPGDLVSMTGYLVEVNGPEIHGWHSSLSRTDSGNGACEILWLEKLESLSQEDLK